ncbi:MAG TPA: ABC transporter substrate-binding protein [Candidatus Ornithospirochaeta avicola]|uniref:ABC transporter substrate-binding protein n=1 Tax=Candidatus Ornithospirochaeta avicola TaxID=2840896 RepID=A0A9D1PUU3_9SPIO|nr:ABC transporter substrate-binding protein [Candidatus Ornithospirochaeta avicola]
MKKVLLTMLIALVALSTVFAGGEKESASGEADVYKIGVLAPAVTHGWSAGVAYYAEKRCEDLKADGLIDYRIYTSNDGAEMTTQIDDALLWGADALVCFPQWTGMEVPIQNVIAQGIPVVNFDIVIDVDGVYRVAGDNYDMGVQSAKYIVDKIGTEGTVVILDVPTSGSVAELRKAGYLDTVAEIAPNIENITYATQFTREAGLADMADILVANPHIDAVYSMDDETSIGALQAIEEAGRTDIKVITGGGGAQEYFKMMPEHEDIWIQSALYSPVMVEDAVDMAYALLQGESVEMENIIPTSIVDRTNYQDYLDETSPY